MEKSQWWCPSTSSSWCWSILLVSLAWWNLCLILIWTLMERVHLVSKPDFVVKFWCGHKGRNWFALPAYLIHRSDRFKDRRTRTRSLDFTKLIRLFNIPRLTDRCPTDEMAETTIGVLKHQNYSTFRTSNYVLVITFNVLNNFWYRNKRF